MGSPVLNTVIPCGIVFDFEQMPRVSRRYLDSRQRRITVRWRTASGFRPISRSNQRFVYSRNAMKAFPRTHGTPADKATIEHLDHHPPFSWEKGLERSGVDSIELCCRRSQFELWQEAASRLV